MPITSAHRQRDDLCPGLLRPFPAEDGAIVRLRLPGGEAPVALLAELMEIARRGAGFLQLTSRGNLQLRGLPDPLPDALVDAVMATGLIPSPAHERVRNILVSPLSGWWPRNAPDAPPAVADVREIVTELDRLICADRVLAGLPGRFLFAVDDGRGDMLDEPFDVLYRALDATTGEVRLAGQGDVFPVGAANAAGALAAVARAFQHHRAVANPAPWHLHELSSDDQDALLRNVTDTGSDTPLDRGPRAAGRRPEPGAVGPHAVIGLPLGRITPAGLAELAAVTDTVILTPWRSVVVPDGAGRLDDLASFATSPASGWAKVSACTGAPGCLRGAHDTEAVARELVGAIDAGALTLTEPVHLVACDRHCGATAQQRHLLLTSDSAADAIALLR